MKTRILGDPRHYQVAVLTALFVYGTAALDFEVRPAIALAIMASALGCQLLLSRCWRTDDARFDPRSALISALSLCLLLRTGSLSVAAAAAVIAIASKFTLKVRGKHVFNPTAIGIAAVLLLTDAAWVSAGQWGTGPVLALSLACFGSLVVRRAHRSDVTWAFLGSYLALLFGRALWLGDPLAIPLHAVSNGAFLIFAFFMISDPRTTPDSRAGRILFAGLVAATALALRFGVYQTNSLIWSLVACAPLVPLIDRMLPGGRYEWIGRPRDRVASHGGRNDETNDDLGCVPVGWWRPAS